MTDQHTIDIPAPINDELVIEPQEVEIEAPKPKRAKAPKASKAVDLTPKQLATELKTTPQKVRRHLRTLYGVHHETWVITPAKADAVRKAMGKKA